MTAQIRRLDSIGFAREDDAAKGTSVAVSTGLFAGISSGQLKSVVEFEDIAPAIGQIAYGQEKKIIKKFSELNFSAPVKADWIGHVLTGLLGSVSSANAGGETTVREHTITVLNSAEVPAYTGYMIDGIQSDKATYMTFKKLTLTCKAGGALMADVEMIGQGRENGTGTAAFVTSNFFTAGMLTTKIAAAITNLSGASALPTTDLKLTIERDVTPIYNHGSVEPAKFIAGPLKVSLELGIMYEATTYRALYEAGTDKAVSLSWQDTATTIGSAENPGLDIIIAKMYIMKAERPDGIDEADEEKLMLEATYDIDEADTNKFIKAILTNTNTATAYTEPA